MNDACQEAVDAFILECEKEGLTAEVTSEDWISNDFIAVSGLNPKPFFSHGVEVLPLEGPIAECIKTETFAFKFIKAGGHDTDCVPFAIPGAIGPIFKAAGIDTKCFDEACLVKVTSEELKALLLEPDKLER